MMCFIFFRLWTYYIIFIFLYYICLVLIPIVLLKSKSFTNISMSIVYQIMPCFVKTLLTLDIEGAITLQIDVGKFFFSLTF